MRETKSGDTKGGRKEKRGTRQGPRWPTPSQTPAATAHPAHGLRNTTHARPFNTTPKRCRPRATLAARYLRVSPLSPQRSLQRPGRCLPPPAAIPLQHRGPLLPLPALLRRRLGQQLRLVAVVAAGRGEGRGEVRGSRGAL